MADPISIRPTIPGGVGGPYPFNSNDVLVWKALICKYLCQKNIETFSKTDFYESLLNGEFQQGGAYVDSLRKATQEDSKLFDNLLYYCLDALSNIGLLKRFGKSATDLVYRRAPRLSIFCQDILKYDMLDVNAIVEPVIQVEEEIRHDENFPFIVNMLEHLRKTNRTSIDEANQRNIDLSTINKLNQLGTISLTLSGEILISPIGRKLVADLSQENTKT